MTSEPKMAPQAPASGHEQKSANDVKQTAPVQKPDEKPQETKKT